MSTAAQILANQSNAARSTGPKSPEGKAASSRNATRHGLTGQFSVLPHESREEYDALADTIAAEHQPEGDNEAFLVNQMIQARWKLLRLERLEALAMEQILTDPASSPDPDSAILAAMAKNSSILDKLARYEAAAERSYFKALRELQSSRARNGKADDKAMKACIDKYILGPRTSRQPAQSAPAVPQRPNLTPEEIAHPALRL